MRKKVISINLLTNTAHLSCCDTIKELRNLESKPANTKATMGLFLNPRRDMGIRIRKVEGINYRPVWQKGELFSKGRPVHDPQVGKAVNPVVHFLPVIITCRKLERFFKIFSLETQTTVNSW